MIRKRIRLWFSKRGDLRFLSHRDLLRTLERLFRRANFELSMSEGFHPKPRMSFPSALAVGVIGAREVMELELAEERTADDVLAAIRDQCPEGLEFLSAEELPENAKKAAIRRVRIEMPIPENRQSGVDTRIEQWMAATSHVVQRPHGKRAIDIRPLVEQLALVEGQLQMTVQVRGDGSVRPREVLEGLGLADLEHKGYCLTRAAVELG